MKLERLSGDDLKFQRLQDTIWEGTQIADVFPADGTRKMSCGVHEIIGPSETLIETAPVDDVLYVLEGELEIDADGVRHRYRAGDFAYLHAGGRQTFIVRERVKHIYVTYPADWKQPE